MKYLRTETPSRHQYEFREQFIVRYCVVVIIFWNIQGFNTGANRHNLNET